MLLVKKSGGEKKTLTPLRRDARVCFSRRKGVLQSKKREKKKALINNAHNIYLALQAAAILPKNLSARMTFSSDVALRRVVGVQDTSPFAFSAISDLL